MVHLKSLPNLSQMRYRDQADFFRLLPLFFFLLSIYMYNVLVYYYVNTIFHCEVLLRRRDLDEGMGSFIKKRF